MGLGYRRFMVSSNQRDWDTRATLGFAVDLDVPWVFLVGRDGTIIER